MSDEPLTDDEFRASMMEFAVIMNLRKQLEAAGERIRELYERLQDQTALKIAEVNYGYREARPDASWVRDDFLSATRLNTFQKTNTDCLVATMYVASEEAHMVHCAQREQLMKQQLMDQLWCEMQKRGLFKQSQRKVDQDVVYSISVEVAKP